MLVLFETEFRSARDGYVIHRPFCGGMEMIHLPPWLAPHLPRVARVAQVDQVAERISEI